MVSAFTEVVERGPMLTSTTNDDDSWSWHDCDCGMLQGFQSCRKNGRREERKNSVEHSVREYK